jgi:hypothetical protein
MNMHEVLYFHITLEPHHKNSGLISGGRIIFLAEVPVDAAKKPATNPADEKALSQEAERLVVELLPIAMSGHLEVRAKMSCAFPGVRFSDHLKTFLNIRQMRRKAVYVCGCSVRTLRKHALWFSAEGRLTPGDTYARL